MDIPYVSYDAAKILYMVSEAMIHDDKHDLGWFTYRNRKNHRYHGRKAPNHESPWHHWQIGGLGIVIAEIMGVLATAREASEALNETKKEQT